MRITDLSIKYRTVVIVLTVILSIAGLGSYFSIPKEAQPSIEIPMIIVTSIYPGVSPGDVEKLVTQPIEREIQNVNGIKEIRSTSTEGVSTVIIEFEPVIQMEEAYQKVRDKVDAAKSELPSDVEDPTVAEIDVSEFPILTINLAADYSLVALKEVAENLQEEIEAIPSILEAQLLGGLEREVKIEVDLEALKSHNLAFGDVIGAVQQENVTIPGGSIDVEDRNYLVRVSGEFESTTEIEDLIVKMPNQEGASPIYMRDVATVEFAFKERTSYSRLKIFQVEEEDGTLIQNEYPQDLNVISLNIKKRSGENILEAVSEVRTILDNYDYPQGTQVVITGDQSKFVKNLVEDLENNIISGIIFVVAVLLFFLGVRTATLVGIAIPLSMFTSFLVFQVMGLTMNFIILFSLIIALGMLVDNAIVIVENIYRFREEGYEKFEAARLATAEVGMAVVASTATTLAVFIPMLFWPGVIGEFMSYMPLTLIITLSCSLFVALVINPVITGYMVRLDTEKKETMSKATKRVFLFAVAFFGLLLLASNWISFVVILGASIIIYYLHKHILEPIGKKFIDTGLPRLTEYYREFIAWVLERDYTVKRAYVRNMFSLVAFTIGFVLYLMGVSMAGIGDPVTAISMSGETAPPTPFGLPGIVLFSLGALGLLVGILGIFVHTVEFIVRILQRKDKNWLITDNRALLMNATLGALFSIFILFSLFPTGVEFFPTTDPRQVLIKVEAPLGTNIESSNKMNQTTQKKVDNLISTDNSVSSNIKNMLIGVGTGGNNIFRGGAARPENSQITLNIVDYVDRNEPSSETLRKLREDVRGIPGASLEFEQDQSGPPTGAPVNIEISGENFDEIIRISREVKSMLIEASEACVQVGHKDSCPTPGLVDIKDNLTTGRPELKVHIDRERAQQYKLNTTQIAQVIRTAINGIEASKYRDGDDEYDITVRLKEADRSTLESLQNLTIPVNVNGNPNNRQQLPISAVADIEIGSGLGSVTRLDLQRVVTIEGGAAPGFSGPTVLAKVQTYLLNYKEQVPAGYTMTYTGESEDQQESFGFLTTALLLGIALIFMILIAQFNRISAPFIIIVAVGLSLIGVLLGLVVTRTPFGLMTFIGVISLAGIVVNNGIVLVDYVMQLRERGLEKAEAIIQGGATRLRPVLLTALTTVIGLIPLTFGINIDFIGLITHFDPGFQIGSENTQFWGPMGIAIISGLTFATFLTLVIVPVMYSIFDSLSEHLSVLFRKSNNALDVSGNGHSREVPHLKEIVS